MFHALRHRQTRPSRIRSQRLRVSRPVRNVLQIAVARVVQMRGLAGRPPSGGLPRSRRRGLQRGGHVVQRRVDVVVRRELHHAAHQVSDAKVHAHPVVGYARIGEYALIVHDNRHRPRVRYVPVRRGGLHKYVVARVERMAGGRERQPAVVAGRRLVHRRDARRHAQGHGPIAIGPAHGPCRPGCIRCIRVRNVHHVRATVERERSTGQRIARSVGFRHQEPVANVGDIQPHRVRVAEPRIPRVRFGEDAMNRASGRSVCPATAGYVVVLHRVLRTRRVLAVVRKHAVVLVHVARQVVDLHLIGAVSAERERVWGGAHGLHNRGQTVVCADLPAGECVPRNRRPVGRVVDGCAHAAPLHDDGEHGAAGRVDDADGAVAIVDADRIGGGGGEFGLRPCTRVPLVGG